LNGAEHFRHAENQATASGNYGRSPKRRRELREDAQIHALLAIAAALGVNQPQPDPDEDSDGWESMMPGMISRNKPGAHWPPRRGDLWQDQRMRTWLAVPLAYLNHRESHRCAVDDGWGLVCLDEDSQEARHQSELTLVFRPSLLADCPF
jgi:hypothetical protein